MKRAIVAGVVAVALAAGLAVFEPWTFWTRSTVVEALPTVSAPADTDVDPAEAAAVPAPPAEPVELSRGEFITQEHATSGVARVLELPDGSRVLRLEGFSTRNGPDLVVVLSEETAGGDWFKYNDVRMIPLGDLKGTDGDQNYDIPLDGDLAGIQSAVIWCDRFNVSFGSAPISL
ncbi:hypothetical protein HMPREF0063_13016 [Aeromicrobium marinum DSM 15272]|uniref:DM13 domain-containing protein n=1 Tax=Aeromicrobium marinum DSM 15272 TaxID=585531 RepID=E2SG57_9ACTN|nr:DM13 domain-containing protein [Aeromicrobium marinum]EFQ81814.1 hypothetical protein HMPREF0063_13016 [Aeromicrobium marinum DSM 15272]